MVCYGPKKRKQAIVTMFRVLMTLVQIVTVLVFFTATFSAVLTTKAAAADLLLPKPQRKVEDPGITMGGSKGAMVESANKDLFLKPIALAAAVAAEAAVVAVVVVVLVLVVAVGKANGRGVCVYATICQVQGTAEGTLLGTLRYSQSFLL